MRCGHSYRPLGDILPPSAKDMIDDIGEELDNAAEMWRPNPTTFPTTKWISKSSNRIFKGGLSARSNSLDVIRNYAFDLSADKEQSIVADDDLLGCHK